MAVVRVGGGFVVVVGYRSFVPLPGSLYWAQLVAVGSTIPTQRLSIVIPQRDHFRSGGLVAVSAEVARHVTIELARYSLAPIRLSNYNLLELA